MYGELNDLRILHAAQALQATLGRFERRLRDLVPQEHVRSELDAILEAPGAHSRLGAAQEALERRTWADGAAPATRELLQSMLECEEGAHQFYLRQLDRLSDPRLVALFRTAAHEEALHAERIRNILDGRPAGPIP